MISNDYAVRFDLRQGRQIKDKQSLFITGGDGPFPIQLFNTVAYQWMGYPTNDRGLNDHDMNC